jgi:hypothetical protein
VGVGGGGDTGALSCSKGTYSPTRLQIQYALAPTPLPLVYQLRLPYPYTSFVPPLSWPLPTALFHPVGHLRPNQILPFHWLSFRTSPVINIRLGNIPNLLRRRFEDVYYHHHLSFRSRSSAPRTSRVLVEVRMQIRGLARAPTRSRTCRVADPSLGPNGNPGICLLFMYQN